jgi:hypothetical protein
MCWVIAKKIGGGRLASIDFLFSRMRTVSKRFLHPSLLASQASICHSVLPFILVLDKNVEQGVVCRDCSGVKAFQPIRHPAVIAFTGSCIIFIVSGIQRPGHRDGVLDCRRWLSQLNLIFSGFG